MKQAYPLQEEIWNIISLLYSLFQFIGFGRIGQTGYVG
jgi:hypothetical protein